MFIVNVNIQNFHICFHIFQNIYLSCWSKNNQIKHWSWRNSNDSTLIIHKFVASTLRIIWCSWISKPAIYIIMRYHKPWGESSKIKRKSQMIVYWVLVVVDRLSTISCMTSNMLLKYTFNITHQIQYIS